MSSDEKKPLTERVAAMLGKTTFRDVRNVRGGLAAHRLVDSDIAAALGIVQTRRGDIVVKAMETYYASTLVHEPELCREWDRRAQKPDYQSAVIDRTGAMLALRRFAGATYRQAELANYAWMIKARRAVLDEAIQRAHEWLQALLIQGNRDLLAVLGIRPK